MDKIKEALGKLFEDKVDEGGLKSIIDLIEVKIEEKSQEKADVFVKEAKELIETEKAALRESNKVELKEYQETLAKTIGKYLDTATSEFFEDHKPAIESEIVVEMSKNVLTSLTGVLKENMIEIPEDQIDVVKDLEKKNSELSERVETQLNKSIEDDDQLLEYQKALKFTALTSELAETQKEKATKLISELSCNDIDTFERKLNIIISEMDTTSSTKLEDDLVIPNETDKKLYTEKTKGKTRADQILEECS